MEKLRVSHFFDFAEIPENEWDGVFAEFAANGAEHLTVNSPLLDILLENPSLVEKWRKCGEKNNISFWDIHGLCGREYDLNVRGCDRRKNMLERHKKAFELGAALGVRNYVMHIGAACCVDNLWEGYEDELRSLAVETLEELLPAAEKNNIVIAIENAFEPSNTPDELLYFLKKITSPSLGACFDAGHATMMAADSVARDRDENNDDQRIRSWHGKLQFQSGALEKLAPWIVTAHLHDNDGHRDLHGLVFSGVADWNKYMKLLRQCPRLTSVQNESKKSAFSIGEMCGAFDKLLSL